MKENRMDSITDGIKERINRITSEAQKQFKGSNPYRQEPKSPRDRLLDYNQLTPDVERFLRQSYGDMVVDSYKTKMEALMRRYVK